MLEQEIAYRASEQSQDIIAHKMVLISNSTSQAIQLFELFSQSQFDICYTKRFDESLVSAVKPQFIVYYFEQLIADATESQILAFLKQQLQSLQQFNLPIILLLDEPVYLSLAPIELPNVTTIPWPTVTYDELLSTVQRIVEEQARFSKFEDGILFKDLVIDTKRMIVKQNNKRIDLTKTEYDLLIFFIGSEGIVQTREALLEKIWNQSFFEGSNIVDVHIKSLRKKLNDSAVDSNYIVTVRGVGYRLADI